MTELSKGAGKKGYILAAGGVLERREAGAVRIAVVHRNRYRHSDGSGGDWVLPKGKCKNGESFEATALRETEEETGCRGRIVGPALPLEYEMGAKHKLVVFFRIAYLEEAGHLDASEVDEVVWLPPKEAMARLTYDSEREIVRLALERGCASS